MSVVVSPTGTCFSDALELLAKLAVALPAQRQRLTLVHALCRLPEGDVFTHGWVEWRRDGQIWCLSDGWLDGERITYQGARREYYATWHVQETTRYRVHEAAEHNRTTGTMGPWIPRYIAHCKGVSHA